MLPWAATLRRQVDEARTDVRSVLQVPAEPLRIAATHSLSLTFFSDWIKAIGGSFSFGPLQLASESLAGCERLMGDGRAQFLLAHSHPATPVRLDPALFRSVFVGADSLVPVAAPGIAHCFAGQPSSEQDCGKHSRLRPAEITREDRAGTFQILRAAVSIDRPHAAPWRT